MVDHAAGPLTRLSASHTLDVRWSKLWHIVDGRTDSRWASGWADLPPDDRAWLAVDLGGPTALCRVSVQWEAASAHTYSIETSADGLTWTEQTRVVDAGSARMDDVALPENVVARHLRLVLQVRPCHSAPPVSRRCLTTTTVPPVSLPEPVPVPVPVPHQCR